MVLQFRMHTTTRTNVYLKISSNPVIEKCTNIGFGTPPSTVAGEMADNVDNVSIVCGSRPWRVSLIRSSSRRTVYPIPCKTSIGWAFLARQIGPPSAPRVSSCHLQYRRTISSPFWGRCSRRCQRHDPVCTQPLMYQQRRLFK